VLKLNIGFRDWEPVETKHNTTERRHMTKLLKSLAVVGLVVGCLVATAVAPSTHAADAAKGRVYLVGVPGAT
jgi:uncharacterized membrane protein